MIFASANAADFSQKTIRLIVSVPAGGNVGMQAAAKGAPDGYTLGCCSIGACAMNVGVYREKLPYHPKREFTPEMLIGMISNILVASNKLPAEILPK